MSSLDEMYREVVLEHQRNPHGREPLDQVDAEALGHNPSCGDEFTVKLHIENDQIKGVCVDGQGCAISVASGSILADLVKGLDISKARSLSDSFKNFLRGEIPDWDQKDIGDLEALAGVRQFPLRVKCALLAWTTLEQALDEREKGD